MNTKKLMKRGFTLVELIIVIAIIAILAVTAFLLLTKRLSKARDSSRASNLTSIENSLQISLTENSSLPKPDNSVLIYASGTTDIVGYQGDFGEGVKDTLGNINSSPKDGDDFFVYYLSNDLKTYQLGALMENEVAYNSNIVSAVDYSSRFINVKGSELGMLFDNSNSPVNKLGLTGVDIQNTDSTYSAYFDNTDKITGTGFILKSLRGGGNLAYGLVGYWSFDLSTGSYIYDDIKGIYKGLLSGGVSLTGGKSGNGLYFNGIDGVVEFGKVQGLNWGNGDGSVSAWFKTDYDFNVSSTDKYGTILINGHGSRHGKRYDIQLFSKNGINLCNMDIDDDNISATAVNSRIVCNDGNWNNMVGIKNGNKLKMYINGMKVGESDIPTDYGKLDEDIGLRFGASYNQTTKENYSTGYKYVHYFSGNIDDIRIYNRALSDSEVKALYNATK